MNNFSSFQITWIEFSAEKGIITKTDMDKIGQCCCRHENGKGYCHFANKEAAVKFLTSFSAKLGKRYACRLFSDKQFGMAKPEENYQIPFTQKQQSEVYYI